MKNVKVIKEFTCPFCSQKAEIKVKDVMIDEEIEKESGFGLDYWTCQTCGSSITYMD